VYIVETAPAPGKIARTAYITYRIGDEPPHTVSMDVTELSAEEVEALERLSFDELADKHPELAARVKAEIKADVERRKVIKPKVLRI